MNPGKKNTLKTYYTIPALVLYGLFFFVQVFYNFDAPSFYKADIAALQIKSKASDSRLSTDSQKGNTTELKIRLNKRFQPVTIPSLNCFHLEDAICFCETSNTTFYPSPFYDSENRFTSSLRGPPAVV